MARYKVKEENLKELAETYNAHGKKELYELLDSKYGIKNPYFVFRRMCAKPDLSYDSERDAFTFGGKANAENAFLSIEELCSPTVPCHVNRKEQQEIDGRPAAMDKLIRELIGERLLELSKYVTIDPLSKRVMVDKTTLTMDGYRLITL